MVERCIEAAEMSVRIGSGAFSYTPAVINRYMKTYKDFVREAAEVDYMVTPPELDAIVSSAWKKHFPKSHVSSGFKHTARVTPELGVYYFTITKDAKDFRDGPSMDDPLNLSMHVTVAGDVTAQFYDQTLLINPPPAERRSSYQKLNFGPKLGLTTVNAKSAKDLKSRLEKSFKKVHDAASKALKNGEFDNYGDDIVKKIKGKL